MLALEGAQTLSDLGLGLGGVLKLLHDGGVADDEHARAPARSFEDEAIGLDPFEECSGQLALRLDVRLALAEPDTVPVSGEVGRGVNGDLELVLAAAPGPLTALARLGDGGLERGEAVDEAHLVPPSWRIAASRCFRSARSPEVGGACGGDLPRSGRAFGSALSGSGSSCPPQPPSTASATPSTRAQRSTPRRT